MQSFAIGSQSAAESIQQWVHFLTAPPMPYMPSPQSLPAIEIVCGDIQHGWDWMQQQISRQSHLPYLDWRQATKIAFRRVTQILSEFDSIFPRHGANERTFEQLRKGLHAFKEGFFDAAQYKTAVDSLQRVAAINGWHLCVEENLGVTALFIPTHIQPDKAVEHFEAAARDIMSNLTEEHWPLADVFHKTLIPGATRSEIDTVRKILASECYFLAGLASYIRGHHEEAIEFTSRAYHLFSDFAEAGFLHAKSLAASGDIGRALPVLKNLTDNHDVYTVKTAMDPDLNGHPDIHALLRDHRDRRVERLKERVDALRSKMVPTSAGKTILNQISLLLSRSITIDALTAEQELARTRDWSTTKLLINYQLMHTLSRHSTTVKSIAFHPDDKLLASGGSDSAVVLWNLEKNREDRRLMGHSHGVDSLCFSPDGDVLYSGGGDTFIQMWNVQSGKKTARFSGHSHNVDSLSVSPDGSMLASGADDATIQLWKLETQENIRSLTGHANAINSIRFDPAGTLLASASSDHTVKLWSIPSGNVLMTLTAHQDSVHAVRFSPDGRYLATAGADRLIIIWDARTGEKIHTLTGHVGPVHSLSFHPEGHVLASGSSDTTIKLWDVTAGKELTTVLGNTTGIQTLSFSHDGTMIACGGEKGIVRVWSKRLLPLKSSTIVMNLSADIGTFIAYERHNEDEMLANVKELGRIHYKQEKEKERERWFNAYKLCEEGKREEHEQDKKWLFRNYEEALKLYQQALDLGYEEALERIEKIRRKMGKL
jgi:WD40 repeat protein